ncbi:MAG: hypothetical protein Kow0075_04800 [Salibacteraceae bacterium]
MKNRMKKLPLALLLTMLCEQSLASQSLVKSITDSDEGLFLVLLLFAIFQLVLISVMAGVIKVLAAQGDIWRPGQKTKTTVIAGFLLLAADGAYASGFDDLIVLDDIAFILLLILNLLLFGVFLYLASRVNSLLGYVMKKAGVKEKSWWAIWIEKLTASVPVEKEEEVELEHVYDGIRELDNRLPPWWLWGFYFTIAFSVVYLVRYHVTGDGLSQLEEYELAVQEAEAQKRAFLEAQPVQIDENNVELLTDEASLAEGRQIFKLYCSPCHGETGGSMPGGVGPNLTDEYWIHGGSMSDIYRTIKYGVPEKGMVSWEAQLSPLKIQQVASYIKSLAGTNPPNAKEPQGELWVEPQTEKPDSNLNASAENG